jgi:hypothetical protein
MRADPSGWFACSVLESIEGLGAYSSRFGGLNPDALKTLCESPYGAAELVRRWVLKCVRRGHIPQKIGFSEKLSELNEQFWGMAKTGSRGLGKWQGTRNLLVKG